MMAQGVVISGVINDDMGPVIMCNVTERDGNNRIVSATQTDMMGNFSMKIKNKKNKLVISYVGCKTKTVKIGDQTTFDIKLEPENTALSEVVVVNKRGNSGGLNIDQKEMTRSQQTFNLSAVEGMAFTDASEALQGEIAGLDIVSNSGNLGSGSSMKLRGSMGNPLIVVDEKIFDYNSDDIDLDNADNEAFSSLLSINVEDIASITVLKDAAATAIWGNKGADGVIQITTKRGNRGKPKVTFSYKYTGAWMPTGYDMLNGDNYTMMLKEAIYNRTQSADATANIKEINYDPSWSNYWNWNNNTDWVKAVKQFSNKHEGTINITGGGQKAQFRISAGYNHQTGTIIKQVLNRFTTRLVLDYNVSDRIRFSTNFALTYTDNLKNYTIGSSKNNKNTNNSILAMAFAQAPNASIYRRNMDGSYTDEYFLMNRTSGTIESGTDSDYTSYQLASVVGIGNPVAYANRSWQKETTYNILPDFELKYELLGTRADQHRLTFKGRVYFDIYANSKPTFMPASLNNGYYSDTYNNYTTNTETNTFKLGARAELVYTPHFKNEDFFMTMLARYECNTAKYTYQFIEQNQVPNGIQSSTVGANPISMSNQPSSTRSADHNWIYNLHMSYKSRYNIGFSLRADGSSKYGPKNPWFYSPSVSVRYNISEEPFFKPLRKVVSMLGLRGSWGINGSQSASLSNYFNQYTTSSTMYGVYAITTMSGLKLDDLRPQKKIGFNAGVNLGFLDDMIEIDLDLYQNNTKDMVMKDIPIPTTSTWNTTTKLAFGNVGSMRNKGWELSIKANKFIKYKKFNVSATFNFGQDNNRLLEMDSRVLEAINSVPTYDQRGTGTIYTHVAVGQPLNSIYGYKYKGVFQYTYDYLQNYNTKMKQQDKNWNAAAYENWINQQLAEGKTFPVVVDGNGKVVMNGNSPQRLTYWYGATQYNFQGGDAIYEDVNHDGTINELDLQYLGNSRPKLQGGFGLTIQLGNWKLVSRFTYRYGVDIINAARMGLESMYGTENQISTVTYRWRKDGDETVMPRALWNAGYNYQMSSRYVEDGSYLRLQNIQISYTFPKTLYKKWGLTQLSAYITMNRLFTFTKYSGLDPEKSPGTYSPAVDSNGTPVDRSVTASISVGF
ncbi:MAG: SusC/RagA family TonB-linked outer membrane protein [Bacteroidaceae bacterium]|nr:SusC/RagA family TonB-linked outer membrane protein [Bacteroidaceae bacterium]